MYVTEQNMFDALVSKLNELVSDGVFKEVIVGFQEDYPNEFPVIYVEILDERFEPATVNKDDYIVEVGVVVETFNEDYQEGQEQIRELAMRVYEKLISDRTLGGDVDVLNVEAMDTTSEAVPDGFIFDKGLTVTLSRWLIS